MAYEFKLPDLGEGLTEGEVARWLVIEGQEVAEDEPLVEIATDKTTVEIPSPAAGTVTQILVPEGEVVPVGTVLVVIGADGATAAPRAEAAAAPGPSAAQPARRARDGGEVRAAPLVRRQAPEQGLVVPVVRGCGERPLEEIDAEVRRLAEAAHAGTLAPAELRGSTFTVTSAGRSAGLFSTPLINHPEVAILGVYRIAQRPVVRDGEIDVRPIGNISVTFDHRVIDGKRAADFGLAVISQLEKR